MVNIPDENKKGWRISNSNAALLDCSVVYEQEKKNKYPFKPNGLWYSFDNDWVIWCRDNEHTDWINPFNYRLEVDQTRILLISTSDELYGFNKEFGIKLNLRTPDGHEMTLGVDWKKVSLRYAGIEFLNYHDVHANSLYDILGEGFSVTWYRSLSLDSGVIWDLSAVTSVEPITEEQSFNDAQTIDL